MDRAQIDAQVARLAEYRKQQQNTKQSDRPTSAAKQYDPDGQPFKNQPPLKPEFHRAHDHAVAQEPEVPAKPHEQDALRATPSGMGGPKAPLSTGQEADRKAYEARLQKTHEQAKARQERADRGKMKDGKDHD